MLSCMRLLYVSIHYTKLAGLRVGMAFSSEQITELINRVKSPYNISELNIKTALFQLEIKEDFDIKLKEILEEKKRLLQDLENIPSIRKIYPSDTNFFLIEFKDGEAAYNKLFEEKILTSKRFPSIPNCLRINIGAKEENDVLLEILKNI